MLVGESAGFADPNLSAGLTLTHAGAREAAFTLLELMAGNHDPAWLKSHYDVTQRARVRQHIRFADFWYAANAQLSDLQEHCREIAEESGLDMTSSEAWAWLARGGFSNDTLGQPGIGGLDAAAITQVTQRFTKLDATWNVSLWNVFQLNTFGAEVTTVPFYHEGKVIPVRCFERDGHRLALAGMYGLVAEALQKSSDIGEIVQLILRTLTEKGGERHAREGLHHAVQALEVMLTDGWVFGSLDPQKARLDLSTPDEGVMIHRNRDPEPRPRS